MVEPASKKKLKDLITPTEPMKYCKQPGGARLNGKKLNHRKNVQVSRIEDSIITYKTFIARKLRNSDFPASSRRRQIRN